MPSFDSPNLTPTFPLHYKREGCRRSPDTMSTLTEVESAASLSCAESEDREARRRVLKISRESSEPSERTPPEPAQQLRSRVRHWQHAPPSSPKIRSEPGRCDPDHAQPRPLLRYVPPFVRRVDGLAHTPTLAQPSSLLRAVRVSRCDRVPCFAGVLPPTIPHDSSEAARAWAADNRAKSSHPRTRQRAPGGKRNRVCRKRGRCAASR